MPEPEPEPVPEPVPEPMTEEARYKQYIEFGKPDMEYDFSWPDENEIKLVDKTTSDWRLSQINYKVKFNEFGLSSIQLVFVNGIASPPCAAERVREFDTLR